MKPRTFLLVVAACLVCSINGYFIGRRQVPKQTVVESPDWRYLVKQYERILLKDSIVSSMAVRIEQLKAIKQPQSDYQLFVNDNGITLMDGSRYVGFIKWNGKTSALDELILKDNQ